MVRLVFRPINTNISINHISYKRDYTYPIRKFDDRFARQNRCEPPPEFPLASPYSRIVHHLSGRNSHALTQILLRTSGSVDGALKSSPLRSLSLRVRVFHPNTRVNVSLLGPCFKT